VIAFAGGCVFWLLRIGCLELGDSKLLMDYFTALTTYASVREPLESILHTEFARILFFGWGVHPKTGFMILSCLLGVGTLLVGGWGLSSMKGIRLSPAPILFVFLVGPVHLFFGYIEWYTQLAAGLLLFQVFALRAILTGAGLGWALGFLVFASCSHLVGLAFVPAAFVLIAGLRRGRDFLRTSIGFSLALGTALSATVACLSFRIRLDASVESTRNLFSFLLPMMREDNPANPPGAWTYAWLSANHLADLGNEILLCGLFPLLLLAGALKMGDGDRSPSANFQRKKVTYFYLAELVPCALFLLIWNPWIGFPADWDLFSFFAWPLLSGALLFAWLRTEREGRKALVSWAAVPAFSIVLAWVVYYHRGQLPDLSDTFASKDKAYYDRLLEAARNDTVDRKWNDAFRKVEKVLIESPERMAEGFSVFDVTTIQRMAEDWGTPDHLCPLAVDFEIVATTPERVLLVLDIWGRVFYWAGGYYNDWCPMGLSGVPDEKAVDLEIAPWLPAGILLTNKGGLYKFPIPSWVDPGPVSPGLTHFAPPSAERFPRFMGDFFKQFAAQPLGRGQSAVDLSIDRDRQEFIVLDTTGNLVSADRSRDCTVDRLAGPIRVDAEIDPRGKGCYTVDWFSGVNLWPGEESPLKPAHEFHWPAVTDLEVGFGGQDLYILDGQGGVSPVSEFGNPRIKPERLAHFHPTGEPTEFTPYITEPSVYFIDLELVPGQTAYYRMAKNFGIYYSEEKDSTENAP
jgi:hypothetical protein